MKRCAECGAIVEDEIISCPTCGKGKFEEIGLVAVARRLKETFEGYDTTAPSEITWFRKKYGDAEAIRIGKMDYIVIDGEYRIDDEYRDRGGVSPLFYNSIKKTYAIIDVKTAITLIDEVYSRVTYMRRTVEFGHKLSEDQQKREIKANFERNGSLIGEECKIYADQIIFPDDGDETRRESSTNIFQCRLAKDTGISASFDEYSFMLMNGQVRSDIDAGIVRRLRNSQTGGTITLLQDRAELEECRDQIQENIFNRFRESDVDIQSISVKSIFEIRMSCKAVGITLEEARAIEEDRRKGYFETVYLASDNNELADLNKSIQTCNCCGKSIMGTDSSGRPTISHLHINTDAFFGEVDRSEKRAPISTQRYTGKFAVGCEKCLEKCPQCGSWHYNYANLARTGRRNLLRDTGEHIHIFDDRKFISRLQDPDGKTNYCSCRRDIDWTYDEKMGEMGERDVIPLEKVVFLNHVGEVIAGYSDYQAFFDDKRQKKRDYDSLDPREQSQWATKWLGDYKQDLIDRFDLQKNDITVTTIDKCSWQCPICHGMYFRVDAERSEGGRCEMCDYLIRNKKHMSTRSDGVIFMRRKNIVHKYTITRSGSYAPFPPKKKGAK